ncbi:FKBP-type peptidyl-prolyl cis-trans isomerase [Chitinophaga horti]|uniref:Peptidyl-prolyl cis-trans isomerase n=1 Tax=Chitinophaga horti TaxID=2920382 RepID=A0ABY6J7H1_9BACT|nr:FKBP-type peptidyl-prolyl cis-trans isomerase [Chitinophaga horti]UYQ94232.1 FKBP-type peptidyl-prolyl cis-trans isomerase [Chitinophaga horti]
MKMKHLLGLAAVLLVVLATACKKDEKESYDAAKQAAKDEEIIKHYIDTANITGMVRDTTGLYYKIVTHGTGTDTMKLTSKMKVSYVGKLLNGTTFDGTGDSTSTLGGAMLMNLIRGWQYGLRKTTQGGELEMLIPSGLAYGRSASEKIPANSVLYFRMKLVEVYIN